MFFNPNRRVCGFTLIELLITLAIAAIAITVVVPGMSGLIQNNRITTSTDDFIMSLNLARSEAVRRGTQVVVCKSTDLVNCTNDDKWDQGWIVFDDVDSSGSRTPASEPLLRAHAELKSGLQFGGQAVVANAIAYDNNGFPIGITGDAAFTICDSRGFGEYARAILITPVGRLSITKATDDVVPDTVTACL